VNKTLTTFAAVAALAIAGIAADASAKDWAKGSKVRIATEGAYAPWNFTDSAGRLVGFEVDLAADLCRRMEVECEVSQQAWEGIIPALQAGKYDVIMAGMSITEKRREVITFSRDYAATPGIFVVTSSSPSAGFTTAIDRLTLDDVDPAERLRAFLDEGLRVGVACQVGGERHHLLARGVADLLRGVVERPLAARADGDVDAFLRKPHRDALADACACACDDANFAV
jgi:octopine/nopaline transport system substrate-binding protein